MTSSDIQSVLDGHAIIRWQGTAMALSEFDGNNLILWESPQIPFLQLVGLELQLTDGTVYGITSQLDDGSGYYGLQFSELKSLPPPQSFNDPRSIFRAVRVDGMPLDRIESTEFRKDGPEAIVEIRLSLPKHEIRILAGEVSSRSDGELVIVEPEESILLQVNGARPDVTYL